MPVSLFISLHRAVAVVNPMEVVKIRLQAQQHSLADPLEVPRYRNAAHALYTIIREEGFFTLYRGVALTAARQATNQAANFTAYQEIKAWAEKIQDTKNLPSYQTAVIGLISGALGPFSNAPIDTIKTRIQRASKVEGETAISRVVKVAREMFAQEGASAFWKGITPRVARVAPGECRNILSRDRGGEESHYSHTSPFEWQAKPSSLPSMKK